MEGRGCPPLVRINALWALGGRCCSTSTGYKAEQAITPGRTPATSFALGLCSSTDRCALCSRDAKREGEGEATAQMTTAQRTADTTQLPVDAHRHSSQGPSQPHNSRGLIVDGPLDTAAQNPTAGINGPADGCISRDRLVSVGSTPHTQETVAAQPSQGRLHIGAVGAPPCRLSCRLSCMLVAFFR